MERFAEWFRKLMDTRITLGEALFTGLVIALVVALVVCIVRDEPIATWEDNGKRYKLSFRGVKER